MRDSHVSMVKWLGSHSSTLSPLHRHSATQEETVKLMELVGGRRRSLFLNTPSSANLRRH